MGEIAAIHLVAGYGGPNILQGVSLNVGSGEFCGLIGLNGCGKSTLLRVLSRILKPSQGEVRLNGQDIAAFTPVELAREVAFVPQNEPALFDFLVRDVVMMGRYPHRARFRTESRADYDAVVQAMRATDIIGLANRPLTHLSGGEHRRVLMARALAQATPLLLLDEPTAHLDVSHQAHLLALTRSLVREQGVAVLAALHELNQAAEYCDRLVLMREGTILADGTPDQVLTSKNLEAGYDVHARIGSNMLTGRPYLMRIDPSLETPRDAHVAIHVVCGGGSGRQTLIDLKEQGYRLSVGVLAEFDEDHQVARALALPVASEAPFSPIGPAARREAEALMDQADIIIVCPAPFGPNNIANLDMVLSAQSRGKKIVLLETESIVKRDYTGGKAVQLWSELKQNGAATSAKFSDLSGLLGDEYPDEKMATQTEIA